MIEDFQILIIYVDIGILEMKTLEFDIWFSE